MMCPAFFYLCIFILVHHNHFGSTSAMCSFIIFCSFLFLPQRPGVISAAAFSDVNNDFRAKKKLDLVAGTTPSFHFSVHIYV